MSSHPDNFLRRVTTRTPEEFLSHVDNAEAFLAVAVIAQAFWDSGLMNSSDSPSHGTRTDHDQAREFLLATHGEWAEARESWATAADIEPNYVLSIARKLEKNPRPSLDRRHGREANGPADDVVERVRERIEFLKKQGIDIRTAQPAGVAKVLNEGGITTAGGKQYSSPFVCDLRRMFTRCVEWGKLSRE